MNAWNVIQAAIARCDRVPVRARDNYGNLQHTADRLNDMQSAPGYAEPGYEDKPVVLGNWNPPYDRFPDDPEIPDEARQEVREQIYKNNLVCRVGKALERLGFETEWSDEWCSCGECGKIVRILADCFVWTPAYWLSDRDGALYCRNCVIDSPSDYLDFLEENPAHIWEALGIDLAANDYVLQAADIEWFGKPGQTNDPADAVKAMKAKGLNRIILQNTTKSDVVKTYSIWVHKECFEEEE